MDTFIRDLKYALRALLRSPAFTFVAVLTLALGIGANATIFSLVNAVLLRPPPHVDEPDRLVHIYTSDFSGPPYSSSSYPDYEVFREQTGVVQDAAAFTVSPVSLVEGGETQRLSAELVSTNYFDVLGVGPAHGRTFAEEEGRGARPVVVISHGLWQRSFGGDPAVVGRSVRLNGNPFTVVGVAPEEFAGSLRGLLTDLWVPMQAAALVRGDADFLQERGSRGLFVIGRLSPGVTIEQAQARFDVVARQLHAAYPDMWTDVTDAGRRITVVSEREARVPPQVRGPALGFMALLLAVVGLVLLICCANVANLLLARAAGRRREIAVRLSLGAGRGRLVRQLLTESVVLALLGGVGGVLLAYWATDALTAVDLPFPVPLGFDLELDARVLGFALAATLATGLLFGLAPALQAARADVVGALKDESVTAGGDRRLSLRNALVVGQVAVSLVLLVGAGLFLRSLQEAAAVDPGFDPEGVVVARFDLQTQGYSEAESREFHRALSERVAGLPGVSAVTLASDIPLSLDRGRRGTGIEGYEPRQGEDMEFPFNVVGPNYLEVMGVRLLAGRGFTEADREGAPRVVVVNETFARRFWPGGEAVGKRLVQFGGEQDLRVVGVVEDGKYWTLTEEPRPYVYLPYLQSPAPMTLHARVAGDPARVLPLVRREIQALDADLPILALGPMEAEMAASTLPQRAGATLLGLFAVLALVLSAVGLYGVLAYAVSRRTREIGIRMAIGAREADVLRLVVRQGLALTAVGAAVGLAGALGVTRFVSGFLYGVSATDPLAFLGVTLLLGVVALLAALVPARRAARIDPATAMRYE